MRKTIVIAIAALLAIGLIAAPASAARGGEKGSPIVESLINVDGVTYGTILLGALPYNNGNAHSFDTLYVFPNGDQAPVAEYAPGDKEYNGGRWLPTPVTWNVEPVDGGLTSAAAVEAAAAAGHVTIHPPDTSGTFLCPLIPNH